MRYPVHNCHLLPVILALSLLITAPASQMPADATGEDWPQYRHDIQRSGRTSAAVPTPGDGKLHLQWAYSVGERVEIEVEPIVAGGKVFFGAMNGVFTALQSSDGSLAWEFKAAGPIPHTAAYDSGRVFFGSLDGYVYALNANDGQLLWKRPTGGPVYAAPAVAGGAVFIGSTAGHFFAFDTASGAQRWRYPSGDAGLATAFTGAAALSPDGSRVYVGNEDLLARSLNTANGALIWERPLSGAGMRSTHPVVSDDGAVVFFQTTKPGVQSYVPTENYPAVAPGTDPTSTWNQYYQTYPERRATFFLNANSGTELWNPNTRRYVPLPIPYWGLLSPVLGPDGDIWFPTPGGASGDGVGDYMLDHDSRLMRVRPATGEATQVAVRSAFQHRPDENGRATFAAGEYLTTISEDLGVYRPAANTRSALAGSAIHLFGSHMDPLAPLPSKHVWRYGGVIAMGGVAGASPPVVVGGMVYYISYGWVFAFGPTDRGTDPSPSRPLPFPARDTRRAVLTYPRSDAPTLVQIRAEIEQRVQDFIAAPRPPVAKFEQAGGPLNSDISNYQVFGMPSEQIRVLALALPHLSPQLQQRLKPKLRSLAEDELFDPEQYRFRTDCLVYGQPGGQVWSPCSDDQRIVAHWFTDNELLVGERLYAMAAYAEATGDWALIEANWSFIKELFGEFLANYDPSTGTVRFERWHVGKLGIASQIGAAAGMLRLATHLGDATVADQARTLCDNLLTTRVTLGRYVKNLYHTAALTALPMRIEADGVPNAEDIFRYNDQGELIPLSGDRTSENDPRQVNWYDGDAEIHAAAGFMYYAALPGFNPLYPELAERIRRDLQAETHQYVQTYEVNAPWWWMNDLAHHTTAGGEHLWHSPTLAYDLFQVKARVLEEDWETLRHQLPLPVSINPRYDLHRLENLVTLADRAPPTISSAILAATPRAPGHGVRVQVTLVFGNNAPLEGTTTATITLPDELLPVEGSASASYGNVSVSGATLAWSGALADVRQVTLSFAGTVNTEDRHVAAVWARIDVGTTDIVEQHMDLFLNGYLLNLPQVHR